MQAETINPGRLGIIVQQTTEVRKLPVENNPTLCVCDTFIVTLPLVTFLMLKPTVGIMSSLNCPDCTSTDGRHEKERERENRSERTSFQVWTHQLYSFNICNRVSQNATRTPACSETCYIIKDFFKIVSRSFMAVKWRKPDLGVFKLLRVCFKHNSHIELYSKSPHTMITSVHTRVQFRKLLIQ